VLGAGKVILGLENVFCFDPFTEIDVVESLALMVKLTD